MTEQFDNDAQEYLLGQMDPARRVAFEQELARSPEARAALKACTDAFAGFATEVAHPEPLSPADQHSALTAILAATQRPDTGQPNRRAGHTAWARWLWPIAAAILLGLNLVEFDRPFAPATERRSATADRVNQATHPTTGSSDPATAPETDGKSETKEKSSATDPGRGANSAKDDATREIERLRANVADLERSRQRLRAEYDALVDRLTNVGAANRELNRLTTMELVDAASFARGERRGLVNVGRGILTEPGVVIATEPPPAPITGSVMPPPKLPYAWSVYDEKEQRGYLNLYNLPTVSGDQALQAWVRSADSRDYQRVSEIPPQFYGTGGSLQYTLPATPAEVLITIESRAMPPVAPTGPTVLRGP